MTNAGAAPSGLPSEDGDRRWAERLPDDARVMVVRGESAWYTELQDFSEGGCGLVRPAGCGLETDDVVRLFFYTDDKPVVIVMARVARVTDARIGIEYHESQPIPPLPASR